MQRIALSGTVGSMVLLLAGCTSHASLHDGGGEEKADPARGNQVVVAPDRCRLAMTILEIDKTLEPEGPCSKVPCTTVVRIDSILAYGFSFPPVLNAGQVLRARFAYTTQQSDRWIPALQIHYPGVRTGTQVLADVELSGSADEASRRPGLVIDHYAIR